jgi:hypothetical protein
MKPYIALTVVIFLGCAVILFAATESPTFPAESKVKILKIQLQQEQLKSEFGQLQARMAEIQKQFPETGSQLQAAIDEAFKAAKIDKKDYSIDMQKLEFVPMPKPEKKP